MDFVLFCFPSSKIQKITVMKHQAGKDWFPQSQGPKRVGCPAPKPRRGKSIIPNEGMYLQNSSLSPR